MILVCNTANHPKGRLQQHAAWKAVLIIHPLMSTLTTPTASYLQLGVADALKPTFLIVSGIIISQSNLQCSFHAALLGLHMHLNYLVQRLILHCVPLTVCIS